MPAELQKEPSKAELEKIVTDETGFAVYPSAPEQGSSTSVPLWDLIDNSWAAPVPRESVHLRIRKVVFQCLDCTYTSLWEKDVRAHANQVREQSESHSEAEVAIATDGTHGAYFYCDSCPTKNSSRSGVVEHIAMWREKVGTHQAGGSKCVLRFALQPPVEVKPAQAVILNAPVKEELSGHQIAARRRTEQRTARRHIARPGRRSQDIEHGSSHRPVVPG